MKYLVVRLLIAAPFLYVAPASQAQLVAKAKCAILSVDILNGTINGLKPDVDPAQFKATVTCSTGTDPDKCGGVVSYKDKDVSFYTQRRYFEIGPKFKGAMSIPILGSRRGSLFKYFGTAKVKDDLWDGFETQYGTLVLHYNAPGPSGRVILIQMSTYGTDELSLCN